MVMDITFHYYITAILCRASGYSHEDAILIANSCQFTDDLTSDIIYDNCTIERTAIDGPCQIQTLEDTLMCYHFVPGDVVGDWPLKHPLLTTPNSFLARLGLVEALKSTSIHRIGIALHAFSDSYAHANYIGGYSTINSGRSILNFLIPAIGHLDRLWLPDSASSIWIDNRLIFKEVNNKRKFLKCAKQILLIFSNNQRKSHINSLINDLSRIIGAPVLRDVFSNNPMPIDELQNYYYNRYGDKLPTYCSRSLFENYWYLNAFNEGAVDHKRLILPFVQQRRRASSFAS